LLPLPALMFGLAIAYSSGTLLNPITLTAGGVGMLGLLTIVVWVQRSPRVGRTAHEDWGPRPLLSLMLLVTAILSFALSGYVLQMYQFFYTVQQYSVFVSGLALAPIVLGNLVVLRWAARVAVEWPRHVVITGGMAAMGAAMLLTALAFLGRQPQADREAIREALAGNLCRCTGYAKILDAVEAYAAARRADA
jgi:hypothetical protein